MKSDTAASRKTAHEVRIVPESAMQQAEAIWSIAFNPHWISDYFRKELDTIYGAFQGEDLHAVAGVLDLDLHFAQQWTAGAGIAAVATAPGQRNQKLVHKLMARCLRDLHAREVPLAMLFPFSYSFYERMGFAITHWLEEIDVPTSALRKLAAGRGDAKNFAMLPPERSEETLPIHRAMCERFNLSPARTPFRCRQMAFQPGKDGRYFIHPGAYIVFAMNRSANRKLLVSEFVYTDEASYWDGIAFLGQMDAQFDTVVWMDESHERLFKVGIPDPKPTLKRVPWMMTRVVHLEAFEKLLPKPLKKLQVYDPLGISAPSEGEISVGELVQLVAGTWKQPDMRFPAELHGIVGQQPAYTIEFF